MAARKPIAFPIEVHARPGQPLGMAPAVFLRDFWQKRPLLIRNAFANFQTPVQPEDLAGLACEEGVLARLIRHDRATDGWTVRSGPFAEELFPTLPDHDWTLLVQDVDKWDPDVRALIDRFDFLPRWRMDDVMISFAATGGSVGAHVDQYDVFLLQAHGHRRWQIDASESTKGKRPPLGFRPDVELKLLQVFKPSHDWVLAPGDMLYLPPNVPHNGVAEDPCLTFSFGMRAPSSAELISDYLDTLIADADENIRYQDPDLALPADPNEIDAVAMGRVITALNAIRMNDPDTLGDWFGRFITTYRAAGEVMAHQAAPPQDEVVAGLHDGLLLQRHPWARLAWRRAKRGASLYVSGRDFALPVKDAQRLAGAEQLDDAAYRALSDKGRAVVQQLLAGGVFQLIDPNEVHAGEEEDDGEEGVLGEVIEGRTRVDAIDADAVSDGVHTVTVHDDGIEVIVNFEDDEEDDSTPGRG
ncbi:cupin domain-containing protein [Stenotrophomonas sp. 24(2023)]|uniref:ribosomal protein uL16 3-hydroxylase n=1 Tax=Stenotrophomonas sp. 24(2023) TaxID=3068324 RepID=UPI0027E0C243|nr:cupin domain-containing protein [Stenotrophomonas sp. 24(2023)]WMJ69747.1 cupin domain-containing protein [Stenotrophomonas sp. 24(2023)]